MSWDRLSDLNDGRHIVYAYCAGKDGGPPCDNQPKLDLTELIEEWGDISTDELRRLHCTLGGAGDDHGELVEVVSVR